jgi:UDP-N-acetylmuramate--alanine ligase
MGIDANDFFDRVAQGDAKGKSVYMLGIGGIGMSALARYFVSRNMQVSGYDRTETTLTKEMEKEGIRIHFEDDVEKVNEQSSIVVYTPAIPKDHKEYQYLLTKNIPMLKRSEALGKITRSSFNICVAGTHGKTTTSTLVAHILRDSGYGCNAFLGGISGNYGVNFWSDEKDTCVIEADEYDRSFLQLNPDVAVVTAMDPDHLDIYGDAESFEKAFNEFASKLKHDGTLVVKFGLNLMVPSHVSAISYDLKDQNADVYAERIAVEDGSYVFDVVCRGERTEGVRLSMGGLHNIENALAAFTVAKALSIETGKIIQALGCFKGVHRRFEYVMKEKDRVLIDDYAHHPGELEVLMESVKGLYPDKKCLLIFQPHLFTRTRDFAEGFAVALSKADETWLLPIYPARELPIAGVSSEMIAEKMSLTNVSCMSKEEMVERSGKITNEVVVVMAGAGDIDVLVNKVKEKLS